MRIGYAAGSMQDQSFLKQVERLYGAGVIKVLIEDNQINNVIQSQQLKQLDGILKPGDELVIDELSSLSLNETDLFEVIDYLKQKRLNLNLLRERLILGDMGLPYDSFLILLNSIKKINCEEWKSQNTVQSKGVRGRKKSLSRSRQIQVLEQYYLEGFKHKMLQDYHSISRTTVWRIINGSDLGDEKKQILKKMHLMKIDQLE